MRKLPILIKSQALERYQGPPISYVQCWNAYPHDQTHIYCEYIHLGQVRDRYDGHDLKAARKAVRLWLKNMINTGFPPKRIKSMKDM